MRNEETLISLMQLKIRAGFQAWLAVLTYDANILIVLDANAPRLHSYTAPTCSFVKR